MSFARSSYMQSSYSGGSFSSSPPNYSYAPRQTQTTSDLFGSRVSDQAAVRRVHVTGRRQQTTPKRDATNSYSFSSAASGQYTSTTNDSARQEPTARSTQSSRNIGVSRQKSEADGYCGLGITLKTDAETKSATVAMIGSGGPAFLEGHLRVGDRIEEIDGWKVRDLFQWLAPAIRGPRGSSVELVVSRPGVAEPIKITIVRDTTGDLTPRSSPPRDATARGETQRGVRDIYRDTSDTRKSYDSTRALDTTGLVPSVSTARHGSTSHYDRYLSRTADDRKLGGTSTLDARQLNVNDKYWSDYRGMLNSSTRFQAFDRPGPQALAPATHRVRTAGRSRYDGGSYEWDRDDRSRARNNGERPMTTGYNGDRSMAGVYGANYAGAGYNTGYGHYEHEFVRARESAYGTEQQRHYSPEHAYGAEQSRYSPEHIQASRPIPGPPYNHPLTSGYSSGGYNAGGYTSGGYNPGGYTSGGYNPGGYTSNSYGGASLAPSYSVGYSGQGAPIGGIARASRYGQYSQFY